MNPVEQRRRHTAVEQLATDVELVILNLSKTVELQRRGWGELGEFTKTNLVRHDEHLSLVDEHLKRIEARFDALNALTFWQRFRWLFIGR